MALRDQIPPRITAAIVTQESGAVMPSILVFCFIVCRVRGFLLVGQATAQARPLNKMTGSQPIAVSTFLCLQALNTVSVRTSSSPFPPRLPPLPPPDHRSDPVRFGYTVDEK